MPRRWWLRPTSHLPSATQRKLRLSLLRLAGVFAPSRARQTPRKVLLLRPDHVGDVLLTTPAVALLRASLPDAHITYLVGPWSKEVAELSATIRRIPLPRRDRHCASPVATGRPGVAWVSWHRGAVRRWAAR